MTRKPKPPIGNAPRGLRQRLRADGTWRIWMEPRAEQRKLGIEPLELDATRLDWSLAEAKKWHTRAEKLRDGVLADTPTRRNSRLISDLIASYKCSPHFLGKLTPATQKNYRACMLQIEDKWGTQRAASFDKAVMSAWYQALYTAKGPRMAQLLMSMMSILFSHAETLGWRAENSNPCFRQKVVTPKGRGRVASWPEIDALISAARAAGLPSMELAIALSLFQGQRQTDIIEARRDGFNLVPILRYGKVAKVWVWSFRRSKKQNDGAMQLHPETVPLVRRALATPRAGTDRLLIEDRIGRPYDVDLFAKRWAEVRNAAAVAAPSLLMPPQLQYRDLRRTFGVLSRAGGASKDDTADVLGNSSAVNPVLGETYMPPSFETASRAVAAIQRTAQKRKKA